MTMTPSQTPLPGMVAAGRGHIALVASIAGVVAHEHHGRDGRLRVSPHGMSDGCPLCRGNKLADERCQSWPGELFTRG
ncbi:hypothetical protein [Nonomuraea sp. NPDC049400]|uniref:hypothetical protein n=1 Tax=Nonomuraea sp. NPDC049400 TaxID=3364352 RepID=UPI0037B36C32